MGEPSTEEVMKGKSSNLFLSGKYFDPHGPANDRTYALSTNSTFVNSPFDSRFVKGVSTLTFKEITITSPM